MCPQHFIIRQNIEKFHSRLLFEERISINLTLIDKQRKIIEKILEGGEDPTLANRMLINLIEAYDLLKSRLDSL